MRPIILLTGKNGQIGGELFRMLPQVAEVVALGHDQLDLLNPTDICRAIREVRPNLIVNAAAYTAVDRAEADETTARAVNAEAPGIMAKEAKKIGAAMVHYSTDYVFDGLKKTPYEEADRPTPVNVYGKTKLDGEVAIRRAEIPHLIFRTSWVYGTSGKNFMLTILQLATERAELRIVSDQIGAPTCSREIAAMTTKILSQVIEGSSASSSFSRISGTYHMTAAGETSWYDFARTILEEISRFPQGVPWFVSVTRGRPVITSDIIPISTREYAAPARRPPSSVLSNSRLLRTFGFKMEDWRKQLHLCLETAGGARREVPTSYI